MKKTIMKITTASVTVLAALTVGLAGANAATLSPEECKNQVDALNQSEAGVAVPPQEYYVKMLKTFVDCDIFTRDGDMNYDYGFVFHPERHPHYVPVDEEGDPFGALQQHDADASMVEVILSPIYHTKDHNRISAEDLARLNKDYPYTSKQAGNTNGNAGAGNGTAPATPPTQPAPAPEQPKEQPKTDNGVTIETPGNDANAEVKNQTDDVTPKQNEIKPGQTDAVAPSDNGVTIDQAGLDANTEAVNAPAANEKQSAGASAEDVKKDETKKQEQGQGQATAVATSTPSADGKGEAGLNPNGSPENLAHTGVVSNTALIASTILGVLGAAVTAAKRVLA